MLQWAAWPRQLGRVRTTERSGGTTKQGENWRRVQREQWRYRKEEEGERERELNLPSRIAAKPAPAGPSRAWHTAALRGVG